MRRRQWRTAVLWVGCTLCVLIAAAFVASGWWSVWCHYPGLWVGINSGDLMLFTDADLTRRVIEWGPMRYGWSAYGHEFRLDWEPVSLSSSSQTVPLWVPFVIVAIPTLLAWRYWPKPVKAGHCRCGYDLTGNTSGVCPECGVEVQA